MHKDSFLTSVEILRYITTRLNNHGCIYQAFVNIMVYLYLLGPCKTSLCVEQSINRYLIYQN
jgi:hypothetical protein